MTKSASQALIKPVEKESKSKRSSLRKHARTQSQAHLVEPSSEKTTNYFSHVSAPSNFDLIEREIKNLYLGDESHRSGTTANEKPISSAKSFDTHLQSKAKEEIYNLKGGSG